MGVSREYMMTRPAGLPCDVTLCHVPPKREDPPVFQTPPTMSEPRCLVRTYKAMCRLPIEDLRTAVAELEARRPPVSKRSRLTLSELKALSDQQARWVPPVAKPPPPRIRCPSPQAIREIRAARIRREEEGNPRFDATQNQQLEIRAAGLRREINERTGYVPPVRADPPVMQTPPPSVLRYPSPLAIRLIRAARLRREEAPVGSDATQNQQLQTDARIWAGGGQDRSRSPPGNIDREASGDNLPLTIRHVTIRGLRWGDDEVSYEARHTGILSEMKRVGAEIFKIKNMIPSNPSANNGTSLVAMTSRIQSLVDDQRMDPMYFKIGITWNPPYRWANRRYGYSGAGGTHMELLICDHDSRIIGVYEASLIAHFIRHEKCLNNKRGDDNRQPVSPHFLYVVFGHDRF